MTGMLSLLAPRSRFASFERFWFGLLWSWVHM